MRPYGCFGRFFMPFCVACLGMLAGCGGGAETKVGSNGSGLPPPSPEAMVAAGAITGLGPIMLAGAAIDESASAVLLNTSAGRSGADLRLGMVVEIVGALAANPPTGNAISLQAQSTVVGSIQFKAPANRSFRMLGLDVMTDQNTLFENSLGYTNLLAGDRVEVFGLTTATPKTVLATRVVKLAANTTSSVELQGTVGISIASSTLINIFDTNINTGGATALNVVGAAACTLPCTPAAGARVRVRGVLNPDGTISATELLTGLGIPRPEGQLVVLDGFVTRFGNPGTVFVGADEVELSATGLSAPVIGSRLQVRGRQQGGVVRGNFARQLGATENVVFEMEGVISDFVSVAEFRVRGELVSATGAIFSGGTAADLANGRRLQVRAVAGAGRLDATDVTIR